MSRIATIKLLIDVPTDAAACDFLSETLRDMPYVIDWGHAEVPADPLAEYTTEFLVTRDYEEGDFLCTS